MENTMKREQKKLIKQRILEVFEELAIKKPFDQVKIDTICKKVGISKVTLFKYFPTKEHLLQAWWANWCSRLKFPSEDVFKISLAGLYRDRKWLVKEVMAMMFKYTSFRDQLMAMTIPSEAKTICITAVGLVMNLELYGK